MHVWERELLVARIVSGGVRCKALDHRTKEVSVLIRRPSREDEYLACEVYRDAYMDSLEKGLMDEGQLDRFMRDRGLWDDMKQKGVDTLPVDIENFKVGLFESEFNEKQRTTIRKALQHAKNKLGILMLQRHAYDHLSCSGVANMAKSRYLIGRSLFRLSGKPFFGPEDEFWDQPSTLLENVMAWYSRNRIDEASYREVARNDPWRTVWASRKVEGSVFGIPVADYTEEQKNLITWSIIYDNAYQHQECPPDAVIEDDDLFDGWMIVQRRKRGKDVSVGAAEGLIKNTKVRGSQEVYFVGSAPGSVHGCSPDDAKRVHDLNDEQTKRLVRQRNQLVQEKGIVPEMDMPDTRQRYRAAVHAKFRKK